MKKMKILHVVNGEHFAGAERVQDLLAEILPEKGYVMSFLILKKGVQKNYLKSKKVDVYDLSEYKIFSYRWFKLLKCILNNKYDIVHCHTTRSLCVIGWLTKILGSNVVSHIHSNPLAETVSMFKNLKHRMVFYFCQFFVDKYICVSSSLVNLLKEFNVPISRIRLARNGVPINENPKETYKINGIVNLTMVALFRERKGLHILLESIRKIVQSNNIRLTLIGKFESEAYEKRTDEYIRINSLEKVIIRKGFSDDVLGELYATDIFVLPSLCGEGIPMVLLEAMSIGLPIVSTTVEGIPELIINNEDGILVEPNDPSSLACALLQLINNKEKRAEIGKKAFKRQVDFFSNESMTDAVSGVYEEIREFRFN